MGGGEKLTLQRYDTVEIKAAKTPEGFLLDSPILTRTGIFEYRRADGTIQREYRPPEEVFRADSLTTFRGKPIIMGHKPVNAANVKQHIIGTILTDGRQDGDNVRADVVIHDQGAIASGLRELSVGYKVDEEWTPGEVNGQRYDMIQRNIRVEHLGLVRKGRAGESARLRLDSAGNQELEDDMDRYDAELSAEERDKLSDDDFALPGRKYPVHDKAHAANAKARATQMLKAGHITQAEHDTVHAKANKVLGEKHDESEENRPMAKTRIDGIEYDAAPEVINFLTKETQRADEAKTKLDEMTAERDGLKAKVDAHTSEVEKVRKDAADNLAKAVKARVDLLDAAKAFKVDKADEMADKDIKLAVIKAVRGDSFDPADKSDAYIEAAFDLAKADKRNDSVADQRQKANQFKDRTDEKDTSSNAARQRMIENMQNAHKGGK